MLPTALLARFLGAAAFAAASLASAPFSIANAQNWRGLYVGLNAGGVWTDAKVRNTVCTAGTNCYFDAGGPFPGYGLNVNAAGSGRADDSGFAGGAQIGYNWQSANLVWGVEADFNSVRTRATRVVAAFGGPNSPPGHLILTDTVSTDYLATIRSRIGFTSGNLLLYVTGGLAIANFEHFHSAVETGLGVGCSLTTNYCDQPATVKRWAGWTAGGGLEWALNRNWSVKGEYLYVDFGRLHSQSDMNRFSLVPPSQGFSNINHVADFSLHIARAGINYRF